MAEIKCPKCGTVFTIDEQDYASIVKQVRDEEFKKTLDDRLKMEEDKHKRDLELLKQQQINARTVEISKLEQKIAELELKAKSSDEERKLAVNEASQKKEKEISELKEQISSLKNDLRLKEAENKLKIQEAVNEKEQQITQLKNDLSNQKDKEELHIKELKEQHAILIKDKETQIEFYKDLKARMSTKLVGETLEQHCSNQFNQIRMTAFPNAYFEKDNDAKTGSKGDFIFKEDTEQGAELISIMFEMKNENDETATKHKNEDFFKELDKDRNEKNCEYAVLVSMLEPDSELYNAGIVDVSYKYPKMYVVRPQCFIPIITLLRNAALNAAQYKNELVVARNQSLDIAHFEEDLENAKANFAYNINQARNKYITAIEEIDKTISHLQKVRDNLVGLDNNLRIADGKVQEITVKSLTKNNPGMKERFEEIKKQ